MRSFSGSLIVDGAALLFLIFLVSSIRSYYRLRHIPGPKLNALSIFPLFRVHLQGKIYDKFAEWSKYGPLVRVAPNTLLTNDPEIIRRANAVRSTYSRSDWYVVMRLTPGKDTVLSTVDDKVHDDKKRKMVAAYSGKECPSLESDIDQCVQDLVDLIDRKYISDPPSNVVHMDLARKIQYFTSDIMSQLSFNNCFHGTSIYARDLLTSAISANAFVRPSRR